MSPPETWTQERIEVSTESPAAGEAARLSAGDRAEESVGHSVRVEDLHAYYGQNQTLRGMSIEFAANQVTAIIGPSGSGKSTVVRCINRMHEEISGARAEGKVMLDELDVYDPEVDVTAVRRLIGMVFQRPESLPDHVRVRQRRRRASPDGEPGERSRAGP